MLVNIRLGKVIGLVIQKRDNQNVPPHGVIGFVHRRLAVHPCAKVDQVLVQCPVVFVQCCDQGFTVGLDNFRFQLFHAAKVVHNDGAVRQVSEVAGVGGAVDALEAKQMVGEDGENGVDDAD